MRKRETKPLSIKRLSVSNFKSFKTINIELGKFNVLIGANASGKTNFVSIFRFLRDLNVHGIDNAVSMQGGTEFLGNIAIGSGENISIEVVFGHEQNKILGTHKKEVFGLKVSESTYKLEIKCSKTGHRFSVGAEKFIEKGEFVLLKGFPRATSFKEESLGKGEIYSTLIAGRVKREARFTTGELITRNDGFQLSYMPDKFSSKMLLLQNIHVAEPLGRLISIYDFDPKLPKRATPISGKAELEEDGSNLAIVLQRLIRNAEKRRQFSNLIVNLLPFIEAVNVERFADRSLIFKLRERYFSRRYLPASCLSDGTIHIAALVVALYFEPNPVTIIEEPERNIHPHLISKLVNMMKDASRHKQLIVTTQNPEVVKHAGIENLLCVSRDQEGFSTIHKPAESEDVKTFLENEVGIEVLYVQDALGAMK